MIRKEQLLKGRTVQDDVLGSIRIASPCNESWSRMRGDDRSRFCSGCQKNVYNVSGMTREEAVALIQDNEREVCLRLYKRSDGKVLTKDCPVGVWAVRRKMAYALSCFLMMLFSIHALAMRRGTVTGAEEDPYAWRARQVYPLRVLLEWASDNRYEGLTGVVAIQPQQATSGNAIAEGVSGTAGRTSEKH
jgi:hypothetical protein